MGVENIVLYKKLLNIQTALKAPKGQYNSFGKYNYRSCEDILEALKPHLKENQCTLRITDEIVQMGERFYVKATAVLGDCENDTYITNAAFAREEDEKKGMDGSQITGTASSYARKYALNGLFLIDDTKDADTDENHKEAEARPEKMATAKQIEVLKKIAEKQGKTLDENAVKSWTMQQASDYIKKYGGKKDE